MEGCRIMCVCVLVCVEGVMKMERKIRKDRSKGIGKNTKGEGMSIE